MTSTHKKNTSGPHHKVHIRKVLRQVHPDMGISSGALNTMDGLVKGTIIELTKVANEIAIMAKKKTVTDKELKAAVEIVMHGQLAQHGVSEGFKAVVKFSASVDGTKDGKTKTKTTTNTAARAGLTFKPSRMRGLMRMYISVGRIGRRALVYMAAVVEYLVAELLELAGNSGRDHRRVRITNRDIMLAIANDAELKLMYSPEKYIVGGGVLTKPKAKSNGDLVF